MMDPNKFSAITQESLVYNNPISSGKINKMIDLMPLNPDDRLVDIGAGTCEIPIRFIEKYGCSVTAVELSDSAIEVATLRAQNRAPQERLTFIHEDAKHFISDFTSEPYDAGICIGSTHAIGDLASTIETLRKCVKKHGLILVGEGYWKQRPCHEYLEALGGEESELKSHYENIKTGEDLGLISLAALTANDDDWDDFEWAYARSIEQYCFKHPDDSDCPAMLEKIRKWKQTYNKWGRDTLGFGLYLFRNA